jgi:hypothetical protein
MYSDLWQALLSPSCLKKTKRNPNFSSILFLSNPILLALRFAKKKTLICVWNAPARAKNPRLKQTHTESTQFGFMNEMQLRHLESPAFPLLSGKNPNSSSTLFLPKPSFPQSAKPP